MFCDLRDIISKENTLSLKAESTISNVRLWACVRGWVFSPTHIYTNRLRYNFLRNCTRIRYGNNKSILQIEPLNNDIETDYQNCDVLWLFTMKKVKLTNGIHFNDVLSDVSATGSHFGFSFYTEPYNTLETHCKPLFRTPLIKILQVWMFVSKATAHFLETSSNRSQMWWVLTWSY